jgi:hypothetical protein
MVYFMNLHSFSLLLYLLAKLHPTGKHPVTGVIINERAEQQPHFDNDFAIFFL